MMRLELVVGGVAIIVFSLIFYQYSPQYLTNTAHSFITSMSGGSTNSASMLRQMGYPSLHQVIAITQYLLVGLAFAGVGMSAYGTIAKKVPKALSVKLVAEADLEGLNLTGKSRKSKKNATNNGDDKVMAQAVNDVLGKLENELKDIKTGYESHKQKIENEKKKLEHKQRVKLAKIIATGEVLIKEITPTQFEDRIKYYVDLKNEETGQLVDLSLLAEKFARMKKSMDSLDSQYISSNEFENMKRLLDE